MDYQQLAHVFQNVIKLMSDNLLSQTECVNCCVWILGNFKAIYATITEINWGKCSGYKCWVDQPPCALCMCIFTEQI